MTPCRAPLSARRRPPARHALFGVLLALLSPLLFRPSVLQAQAGSDEMALQAIRSARGLALGGAADSAVALYLRAAASAPDRAVRVTALRGAADLLAARRPCTDSAERVLRAALAASDQGDRSAADALVRLLAARGKVAEARRVLVAAYADVPSLGRAITKESMRYLQGQAAVERAAGAEAAALSALTQALGIAARLRHGDVSDSVATPTGDVDAVNAWVMYDLAMLRMTAKSPSVRSPREGTRLMAAVAGVPQDALDGGEEEAHPLTRLDDRLTIARLAGCSRSGTACPPPAPPGC